MTLVEEALRSLKAAVRLLGRDISALTEFNLTIQGFWRSFAAIVPMAAMLYPMTVYGPAVVAGIEPEARPQPPDFAGNYLYLVAAVALWPVLAAALARLLGAGQHYVRYMIAYNWAAAPLFALNGLPYLVHALGFGAGAAALAYLALIPVFGYFSWYIARTALETVWPIALAFMLADLTMSFGLNALI